MVKVVLDQKYQSLDELKEGKVLKGRLKEATENDLLLELESSKKKKNEEPSELRVAMSEIEKANVLVSFK